MDFIEIEIVLRVWILIFIHRNSCIIGYKKKQAVAIKDYIYYVQELIDRLVCCKILTIRIWINRILVSKYKNKVRLIMVIVLYYGIIYRLILLENFLIIFIADFDSIE